MVCEKMKISGHMLGFDRMSRWAISVTCLLVAAVGIAQDGAGAGESVAVAPATPVPERFDFSRFAGLLENSPFAVATAAPAPEVPKENFATNWTISSMWQDSAPDGGKRWTVNILSRDLQTRMTVRGEEANEQGVSIVGVEERDHPTKAVVTLKKEGEVGTVQFDQARIAAAPPPPPPPMPAAKTAAKATAPGGAVPKAVSPSAAPAAASPIPRPGLSRTVPMPGSGGTIPPPAPTSTNPSEIRKRIRPIATDRAQ
jgi:hypothetical protein